MDGVKHMKLIKWTTQKIQTWEVFFKDSAKIN